MKKNIALALLLFVLSFTSTAFGQSSTIVPFYIIIGQSNTGWAPASAMSSQQAALYGGVIPGTQIWNPANGNDLATWQPLTVGANTRCENYNDPTQFGPEASFFKSLQDQLPRTRLVYKQGQGGTTLATNWRPPAPGEFIWQAGFRWQQFRQWLSIAVDQANQGGYKLDLKGIIWMQGEDDGLTLQDATAYLANLSGFFSAIDNMWQGFVYQYGFPNNAYKKVVGRIYAPIGYPFKDLVRTAQEVFCANPLNNAILINCDNYPLQDWVHYSATGQVQFGLDIFNAANFEGPAPTVPQGISFSGNVLLQGAYNTTAKTMNNSLNTLCLLQMYASSQPYTNAPFNYAGSESVGPGFFASNPDIVDWVLVELRNESTPSTVVARRAAFVKRDGTLVDINGTSTGIFFEGVAKANYFVVIRHRNHLGIRSASALDFSNGTASLDFSKNGNRCYQSQSYTSTVQVGGDWLMRGGNADLNSSVKYNGPANDQDRIQNIVLGGSLSLILTQVYSPGDVNMDGTIRTNGPENDQNVLLNYILNGVIGTVYIQQL